MGLVWLLESNKSAGSADFDGQTQSRSVCGVSASPWTTAVISWCVNEGPGRAVEDPTEARVDARSGQRHNDSHSFHWHFIFGYLIGKQMEK